MKSTSEDGVGAIEAILYKATEEALDTVGESTRQAFLRHLRQESIPFSASALNILQAESKLRQFFGSVSPAIIQMIYQRFVTKAVAEDRFSPESISKLEKLTRNSNTEVLLRLASKPKDDKIN